MAPKKAVSPEKPQEIPPSQESQDNELKDTTPSPPSLPSSGETKPSALMEEEHDNKFSLSTPSTVTTANTEPTPLASEAANQQESKDDTGLKNNTRYKSSHVLLHACMVWMQQIHLYVLSASRYTNEDMDETIAGFIANGLRVVSNEEYLTITSTAPVFQHLLPPPPFSPSPLSTPPPYHEVPPRESSPEPQPPAPSTGNNGWDDEDEDDEDPTKVRRIV